MKKIWVINHYATPPDKGNYIRQYYFAKNLKDKYNFEIFAASKIHNSNMNIVEPGKKIVSQEFEGVSFNFLKTRDYSSNGLDRVINMLEYAMKVPFLSINNRGKPDIIYASSPDILSTFSSVFLAKRLKAKLIVEVRDLWPITIIEMGSLKGNSFPAKILFFIEKYIYKKADALVFTMEDAKQYIADKGWSDKVSSDKIFYINNGVDLDLFDYNQGIYKQEDQDLDSGLTFKVIYTGSIGKSNELTLILEAAEIIRLAGYENIRFLIYGDGFEKERLERLASEKHLENVFFKGLIEKRDVPYVLSKGDLNIITGKNMSFYKYGVSTNKFFEYLASGRPVVSNLAGHKMINEEKTGIYVEGTSPEKLAEAILMIYNLSKEDYDLYCNNAREAVKKYDYKILSKKIDDVISYLEKKGESK